MNICLCIPLLLIKTAPYYQCLILKGYRVHTSLWEVDSNPQKVSMPKKRCPNSRSINAHKHGFYRTRSLRSSRKRQRRIQGYYSLDCHKQFSERAKAKNIKRYEPSLILKAADLYFNTKASYRAVGRQLPVISLKELLISSNKNHRLLWFYSLWDSLELHKDDYCELSLS